VQVSTPSDKQSESPDPAGRRTPASAGDPASRPTRRTFSPEYKLAMVAEYENAANGEKGAILRREGLYSSHIIEWTRGRDAGALTGGPAESPTSAKRVKRTAEQVELEKLRRRNEKLESDLKKTRMALDIMGKAHALLEELSESTDDEPPKTS
jgi:transposase